MSASTGSEGKVIVILVANQAQKVTLRPNAKSYSVQVHGSSAAEVRVGTATGAVEGGASPTNYNPVAIGGFFAEGVLQADAQETNGGSKHIWVFSTGAGTITVSDYPRGA
jgi:hypothetical protein